jgi:hypothetical protein
LGCAGAMKPLPTISSISALHFVLSFGAFWHSLGSGLGRIDSGAAPSLIDRTCDLVVDVLWFPFLQVANVLGVERPCAAEWLLMVASSVLWGAVLYGVFVVFARLLRPSRAAST